MDVVAALFGAKQPKIIRQIWSGKTGIAKLAVIAGQHNPYVSHAVNLKQLEYFVHIAELGSFTRAADHLKIAQPALSRQVRQLEIELRQNLLMRNGRGFSMLLGLVII